MNELIEEQGAVSIKTCRLTNIGIPLLKIRRSRDHLIFNMEIPILEKDGLYIKRAPWFLMVIPLKMTECSMASWHYLCQS